MVNNIAIGIIIGLFFISLIIIFCVVLIKLYIKRVRKYTQQLYQRDIEFQKSLNETILETQEHLLNNISQDLHDDAGQQLTYINFQLENLKLDSAELNTLLEPLSQSVAELSSSIRSISHSLNNQVILQQDLFKAITKEVERLQKNSKIKIELQKNKYIKKEFTSNEKIIIYRIFQEIISNIFKHARAREIKVTLSSSPSFVMTIQDNGKGFDQNIVASKQSLGLRSMASRAAIINYELNIISKIGEGTTITLSEN